MVRVLRPLLLVIACMAALPAAAGDERDSFLGERPGFDEPLRFRAENGGAFRPEAVIVTGAGGALAAKLPRAADALSENRVDLSGAPVLGPLFRGTLDVASVREGALVGPVYRVGDTLVVDATAGAVAGPAGLQSRPVAIATNIPRYGAISYGLGLLDWRPVTPPAIVGAQVGTAHVVNGALVLASQGGEPAWPSLDAMFRDLF